MTRTQTVTTETAMRDTPLPPKSRLQIPPAALKNTEWARVAQRPHSRTGDIRLPSPSSMEGHASRSFVHGLGLKSLPQGDTRAARAVRFGATDCTNRAGRMTKRLGVTRQISPQRQLA